MFDVQTQSNGGVRLVYLGETTVERTEATLTAEDKVINTLHVRGEATPAELADATGLDEGTVKNTLSGLKRRGRAYPVRRGVWSLSSSSFPLNDNDNDDNAD
jgi:DNA-directed RNA polymerase specialized sigma24 family protein